MKVEDGVEGEDNCKGYSCGSRRMMNSFVAWNSPWEHFEEQKNRFRFTVVSR